jgi:hypothetical protein
LIALSLCIGFFLLTRFQVACQRSAEAAGKSENFAVDRSGGWKAVEAVGKMVQKKMDFLPRGGRKSGVTPAGGEAAGKERRRL